MRVSAERLDGFLRAAMAAAGASPDEVPIVAGALVWADLTGRYNHGIVRLPVYLKRLRLGLVASPSRPESTTAAPGLVRVDGRGGFGHYVGHLAMTEAIALAARHGLGAALVKDSNDFGAGAYFVQLACERNMIGIATSNAVPKVAAHGGSEKVLGTNPFAFGAPRADGRSILVDFATAAAAGSTIRKAKETGEPIPEGIAVDEDGRFITEAARIAGGALLPFGGPKGFGLGILVEVLSAVLSGAAVSHEVASTFESWDRRAGNGHFFLALDIASLLPIAEYHARIDRVCSTLAGSRRQPGFDEILLPGERRWRARDDQRRNGIALDGPMRSAARELAGSFGLEPLV
jgi:LDH2 family malate/lactate/ureidoglycolate dehydrogenase